MKITLLGCGSSAGVPLIGCACAVCRSPNPRDARTRVSLLVEEAGARVLVDTSPDLRQQALKNGVDAIDAIIFTHDHADHTHGIDDIRSFNFLRGDAIDAYGDARSLATIQSRFAYAFQPPAPHIGWFRPSARAHVLAGPPYETFSIGGLTVQPFEQPHGKHSSLGLRFGAAAYSTDVSALTPEMIAALRGVDTWIVDCLRIEPSPTHAHLALTLEWIEIIKPRRAILTHMGHELGYDALCAQLPGHIEPGYDGLVIEL